MNDVVKNLLAQGLNVAARVGLRAAAVGAASVLDDAERVAKNVEGRIKKAKRRALDMLEDNEGAHDDKGD